MDIININHKIMDNSNNNNKVIKNKYIYLDSHSILQLITNNLTK